jgi:hypothetical protein
VAEALRLSTVTDSFCANTIQHAAQLLQTEHPWMTPRRLDYIIWDFKRSLSAARSGGPS